MKGTDLLFKLYERLQRSKIGQSLENRVRFLLALVLKEARRWSALRWFLNNKTIRSILSLLFRRIVQFCGRLIYLLSPNVVVKLMIRHTYAIVTLYTLFFFLRRVKSWILTVHRVAMERLALAFGSSKYKRMRILAENMNNAATYEEWKLFASEMDFLKKGDEWRYESKSDIYDYKRIETMLIEIKRLNDDDDIPGLMSYMRSRLLRNIAGTGNKALFSYYRASTKHVIEEYVSEVVRALHMISIEPCKSISNNQKLMFFNETRHAFGRSALLLSGGSTLGMYHVGVVKALAENKLLPKIISGASAGAIIASWVGVMTESELATLLEPGKANLEFFPPLTGSVLRKLLRLCGKGVLFDIGVLQRCLRANIGDITFCEAYARSGRVVNIVVAPHNSPESARLLNYLTSPNVVIWSAACASAAIPFVFEPVELLGKDEDGNIVPYYTKGVKWSDGSFRSDLPMKRLAELFNVNQYIVSQVNPHVIPFAAHEEAKAQSQFVMRCIIFLTSEVTQIYVLLLNFLKSYVPSVLRGSLDWLSVIIHQKYFGDITILPKAKIADYLNIVTNPDHFKLKQCSRETELLTFRKMSEIKIHCDIEVALDECVRRLRGAMMLRSEISLGSGSNPLLGNRLLSWAPEQFQLLQRAAAGEELNQEEQQSIAAAIDGFVRPQSCLQLSNYKSAEPKKTTTATMTTTNSVTATMTTTNSVTATEQALRLGVPVRISRSISNDRLAQVADSILTPVGMETQELGLPQNRDSSETTCDLYIA